MNRLDALGFVAVLAGCAACAGMNGSDGNRPTSASSGQAAAPDVARNRPILPGGCGTQGGELPSLAHRPLALGAVFDIGCPPNCQNDNSGVWGTDTYTIDSGICKAAVHAGAVSQAGGVVALRIAPALPVFSGSHRNGVGTSGWDHVHQGGSTMAYVFVTPGK